MTYLGNKLFRDIQGLFPIMGLRLMYKILEVGVADVVKALVHHVGIATIGVRVPAAATE